MHYNARIIIVSLTGTWRRAVEKEQMAIGYCSWVEAGLATADRMSWKSKLSVPTPYEELEK